MFSLISLFLTQFGFINTTYEMPKNDSQNYIHCVTQNKKEREDDEEQLETSPESEEGELIMVASQDQDNEDEESKKDNSKTEENKKEDSTTKIDYHLADRHLEHLAYTIAADKGIATKISVSR